MPKIICSFGGNINFFNDNFWECTSDPNWCCICKMDEESAGCLSLHYLMAMICGQCFSVFEVFWGNYENNEAGTAQLTWKVCRKGE